MKIRIFKNNKSGLSIKEDGTLQTESNYTQNKINESMKWLFAFNRELEELCAMRREGIKKYGRNNHINIPDSDIRAIRHIMNSLTGIDTDNIDNKSSNPIINDIDISKNELNHAILRLFMHCEYLVDYASDNDLLSPDIEKEWNIYKNNDPHYELSILDLFPFSLRRISLINETTADVIYHRDIVKSLDSVIMTLIQCDGPLNEKSIEQYLNRIYPLIITLFDVLKMLNGLRAMAINKTLNDNLREFKHGNYSFVLPVKDKLMVFNHGLSDEHKEAVDKMKRTLFEGECKHAVDVINELLYGITPEIEPNIKEKETPLSNSEQLHPLSDGSRMFDSIDTRRFMINDGFLLPVQAKLTVFNRGLSDEHKEAVKKMKSTISDACKEAIDEITKFVYGPIPEIETNINEKENQMHPLLVKLNDVYNNQSMSKFTINKNEVFKHDSLINIEHSDEKPHFDIIVKVPYPLDKKNGCDK